MTRAAFDQEYEDYCSQHGTPDRLEVMMVDTNAMLRGKWLPGKAGAKLTQGELRLPVSTYALNVLGQDVEETGFGVVDGDPDGIGVPILGSLKKVPWYSEHVAQVMISLTDETGHISWLDPREQLRRQIQRFEKRNLTPVVATELEFYLIQPRSTASDAPTPPEHTPEAQPYDLDACFLSELVLKDILDACAVQGIPSDTLIAEYSPGQFEVNFHHCADAVKAADYAVLFRRLVRHVARRHGLEATFMAKPYRDNPGNGMHVHMSLIDENGNNIMADIPAGKELSPALAHAVAGVLDTMDDCQAIFAPHMNSYRRFQPNSFAPSAPNWGFDHRGAAVRIPASSGPAARFEHRICGADVNPYLALSAILGGVILGWDEKMELGLPLDHPDAPEAPRLLRDWEKSVDMFERSELTTKIFGEEFCKVYTAIRRNEISLLTTPITPMEYQTYLGRI